jgi:hypothetical protein
MIAGGVGKCKQKKIFFDFRLETILGWGSFGTSGCARKRGVLDRGAGKEINLGDRLWNWRWNRLYVGLAMGQAVGLAMGQAVVEGQAGGKRSVG